MPSNPKFFSGLLSAIAKIPAHASARIIALFDFQSAHLCRSNEIYI